MKYLLLLVAAASTTIGFSQKAPIKFGDINNNMLMMTSYEPDSSAEAVVLADYGQSVIEYSQTLGFQLYFERTRRIKVLTEAGKKWADFSIQLYSDNGDAEKVTSIRAVAVNLENGKAVESKLEKDAVFREKYSKNIDIVKITVPNVKVGSVFDITYRTSSDFLFNFQDWAFQTTIPIIWSEYRASIPEYFIYDKYMQGYIGLEVNEPGFNSKSINPGSAGDNAINYRENTNRWVATNVPAFRDEPFMTTRNDYISRMNFELATIAMPGQAIKSITGSWDEINKRYAESSDFLGEVNGNPFLRKLAEEVTASATTVPLKVEAICAYVRQNVAWTGESRITAENTMRQVLDNKRGSSAEINLLIASMIEKLGISVRPVLLSTRDHGFLREATPAAQQFNYSVCVVHWDDKRLLLDGTNSFLPVGFLPSRCLNGKGLAVSKEGFEWIPLSAPAKSRSVVSSELEFSEDGVLAGFVKLEHHGYKGAEQRQEYTQDGEAEYVKEMVGNRAWELSKSEYINTNDLREAFKEKHDVLINEHISMAGDVMYMNPFIVGNWTSNPFKSEARQYPVDFGTAFDEVYTMKLKIPEGFVADELPAPKAFVIPGNAAKYTFSSVLSGGAIMITSMLSVNQTLFSSTEYVALREFFNQVVAKQTEQIVIKRK